MIKKHFKKLLYMFYSFKWAVSSLYSLLIGEQLSSIMESVNYAAATLGDKAIGAECGDTE
jgi:hypothetical protein